MTDKPGNNVKPVYELGCRGIATVLDSLDALVYVADMDTYELLFCNKYGRDILGEIQGKICCR